MGKITTALLTAVLLILAAGPGPASALDGYYNVHRLMSTPLDQAESYVIGAVDGILVFLDRVYHATLYCPNGLAAPNSTDLMWVVAGNVTRQLPQAQWATYGASPFVADGLFRVPFDPLGAARRAVRVGRRPGGRGGDRRNSGPVQPEPESY